MRCLRSEEPIQWNFNAVTFAKKRTFAAVATQWTTTMYVINGWFAFHQSCSFLSPSSSSPLRPAYIRPRPHSFTHCPSFLPCILPLSSQPSWHQPPSSPATVKLTVFSMALTSTMGPMYQIFSTHFVSAAHMHDHSNILPEILTTRRLQPV